MVYLEKFKEIYLKNHKYTPIVFFFLGFLFDILTLDRIDDAFNITSQFFYLCLISSIIYLDFLNYNYEKINWCKKVLPYKTEVLHFFLGALLSAYTIFYFKSSSLSTSFIFMLGMAFLLIINELPHFKKLGPPIKFSLLMLCHCSFFICLIPIILGKIGPLIFLLSILSSLLLTLLSAFMFIRSGIPKASIRLQFVIPQVSVALFFIILYFTKIIPPVPLSLKTIGIYHQIEKVQGGYKLKYEDPGWKFWRNDDQNFLARKNDRIFVFVRIFSPTQYMGKINLHWQRQDTTGNWLTSDKIPLSISGGRLRGYRGLAYKKNYREGSWRILVETEFGLELGRISMDVRNDNTKRKRVFITELN